MCDWRVGEVNSCRALSRAELFKFEGLCDLLFYLIRLDILVC